MDTTKTFAGTSPDTYLDLNPCQTFSNGEGIGGGQKQGLTKADAAMSSCVLGEQFENRFGVGPYSQSVRGEKKARQLARAASKGSKWYNMPKPEVDDATKKDLQLLKMRSLLDPSRPYRNQDLRKTPKFFHVGTVVESATDFYSNRAPRRKRGRTLVDELMADANFQNMQRKRMGKVHKEYREKQLIKNKIMRKQHRSKHTKERQQ